MPTALHQLLDKLLTLPQYLLPQHLLSRGMHALAGCKIKWVKNTFIRFIVKAYGVDTSEAVLGDNVDKYASFNDFFTRELHEKVHTIVAGEHTVVSPVDGAISQLGLISEGRIVQAKGQDYSVLELLGGDTALAAQFSQGQFATIYLSPKDYHRIHMPLTGALKQMRHVPGDLFSVSPRTARAVPRLFSRNERVITVFDTEMGPMVIVLVGAIFVGSMETVWAGKITPPYSGELQHWEYQADASVTIEKGTEMGRFNMGSTVVLLLPNANQPWDETLTAESAVRLGQALI